LATSAFCTAAAYDAGTFLTSWRGRGETPVMGPS